MTDYINRNQKNKKKSIGSEMLEQEASTEFQSFHLGKKRNRIWKPVKPIDDFSLLRSDFPRKCNKEE